MEGRVERSVVGCDVVAELVTIDHHLETRGKFEDSLKLTKEDLVHHFSCWRDIMKYLNKLMEGTLTKEKIVGYLNYIIDLYVFSNQRDLKLEEIIKSSFFELRETLNNKNLVINPKLGLLQLLLLKKQSTSFLSFL